MDDELDVLCLLVAIIYPELQKRFEIKTSYYIIGQLKIIFQEKADLERYNATLAFIERYNAHILKMMALVE